MPGSSWAWPNSQGATEERNSWRSKGREYAIASGDTRRQVEAWNEVGGAMLFGRTPVEEVLAFLDEELAWAQERGLAAVEADALLGGPYLYARLGRFEEARDRLERSKSICRERGIAYGLAEAHSAGAGMGGCSPGTPTPPSGSYATRSASRRTWARRGTSRCTAPSSLVFSWSRAGTRMHPPNWSRQGTSTAIPRGRLPAHSCSRGAGDRGGRRARREAIASMADSDNITAHAEILADFAEVLRAHGDLVGAADALAAAVGLHEEKGNVLPARRCRELLAAITAEGPAATTR